MSALDELTDEERKAAQACPHRHTKYQPTNAEFCCPRCGAKAGDFAVGDSPNFDCPLLHDDDGLVCYGPNGKGCKGKYGTDGKSFAASIVRKKRLVPCPHCKGKAYVAAPTSTEDTDG